MPPEPSATHLGQSEHPEPGCTCGMTRNPTRLTWDPDCPRHGRNIAPFPPPKTPAPMRPCPATELLVLAAVDKPHRVRCGKLEGHDGPHVVHMEWS